METYDGTKDPLDHLNSFKTLIHLLGVLDEIICRAFLTMLKRLARVWFNKITLNSISKFYGVEWALCHTLHWRIEIQEVPSKSLEYQAKRR